MRIKTITLVVSLAAATIVALTATPAGASPRGLNGQIAFTRSDGLTYRINPDGSHEEQVFSPDVGTFAPHWSPDGSRIAEGCCDVVGFASFIVNPDTSSYTELAPPDPTLFTGCFFWSPDGQRLACEGFDGTGDRTGIYTIRSSDGEDLTRVTSNPGGDDFPGSYSPEGQRLVFSRTDQNGNPLGLFVVNLNGNGLKQIVPTGTITTSGGDWSPQGNEIIFSEHATPDSYSSIWVVHADGTGLHEIHVQGTACGGLGSDPNAISCARPSWSPDGKQFAFSLFNQATGQRNIYTANADGSNVRQVTHGGFDDYPDWGTHPLAH